MRNSSSIRFRTKKVLNTSVRFADGLAYRNVTLLGFVDDRWPDPNDPCDKRFDLKELVISIASPGPSTALTESPRWRAWKTDGLAPFGYLNVKKDVAPIEVDGHKFPPIICDVWLAEFGALDSLITGNPRQMEGDIGFKLSDEEVLNHARESQLRQRYLRDIDVSIDREFPVDDFSLRL